jgi:hypothetical protein
LHPSATNEASDVARFQAIRGLDGSRFSCSTGTDSLLITVPDPAGFFTALASGQLHTTGHCETLMVNPYFVHRSVSPSLVMHGGYV